MASTTTLADERATTAFRSAGQDIPQPEHLLRNGGASLLESELRVDAAAVVRVRRPHSPAGSTRYETAMPANMNPAGRLSEPHRLRVGFRPTSRRPPAEKSTRTTNSPSLGQDRSRCWSAGRAPPVASGLGNVLRSPSRRTRAAPSLGQDRSRCSAAAGAPDPCRAGGLRAGSRPLGRLSEGHAPRRRAGAAFADSDAAAACNDSGVCRRPSRRGGRRWRRSLRIRSDQYAAAAAAAPLPQHARSQPQPPPDHCLTPPPSPPTHTTHPAPSPPRLPTNPSARKT